MTIQSIHSRAMLVSLQVSTWTARKYDRKVTDEVNRNHGADKNAGRYNKRLLPGDAPSYRELMGAASESRRQHYVQTLPWSDEGWRLLPSANFLEYTEALRKARGRFDSALRAFVLDYPALATQARALLNGMWSADDYPSESSIEGRFSIVTEFSPVPASGDFRLDLPEDQLDQIRATTENRVQAATQDAMRDAWGRLFESVTHIQERLADPKGVFRDSLVENARELVDVLGRLNVSQDPELDRMRSLVRDKLTRYDAVELRENAALRTETAKSADEIIAAMRDIYGGAQ